MKKHLILSLFTIALFPFHSANAMDFTKKSFPKVKINFPFLKLPKKENGKNYFHTTNHLNAKSIVEAPESSIFEKLEKPKKHHAMSHENIKTETFFKAIKFSNLQSVKYLLNSGISPNSENIYGIPAIWYALENTSDNAVHILELIFGHGGKPTGKTRYSIPIMNGVSFCHVSDTWLASCNKKYYLPMIELLLKNGMNPNTGVENAYSPLFEAARAGNISAMQCLIQNGADVNYEDFKIKMPIKQILRYLSGHPTKIIQAVDCLIANKAQYNILDMIKDVGYERTQNQTEEQLAITTHVIKKYAPEKDQKYFMNKAIEYANTTYQSKFGAY